MIAPEPSTFFSPSLDRALAQRLGYHCAQLHGVYHAIAVLVEAREDALHLVVRQQADSRPRRKRHAGQQRAAVPLQGCLNPAKDPTLTFVKASPPSVFAWGFGGNVSNVTLTQIATDPSKAILANDLAELTSYLDRLKGRRLQ